MLFAVLFEDNPGQEHLRQKHLPHHLEFLENHGGCLGAGPLFTATGEGHGGMWLIDAEDSDAVHAMVRADPFHDTGLRRSITILEWRQVLRDGKRLV